jgi:nucleotide-binding universal stress UspA family protein
MFDATVVALHVRENDLGVAPECAAAAGVELREVSGRTAEAIVAAAADPDVAALVLGAGGEHGGPQPAGHTALEVITRVLKPVIVVPPNTQPVERFARILVPLEGAAQGSPALDAILGLAHRQGLDVLVLHVHSPATVPAFADHDPYANLAWEQEFLSRHISAPRDRITVVRRLGVPTDHVVSVADDADADLIVLAWNQDITPGHASIVSETLSRTDLPVLLLAAQ